jgi:transcriptional regulator with XRE-family HTH domain
MEVAFGSALKEWRGKRRMSQIDLGLTANVSARHVAFLETGRSRPSRSMVLQLAEALNVPRPARNVMLNAAGFAAAYRARTLDEDAMRDVRAAVDWTISRHEPYPAIVLDRHWGLVAVNAMAAKMTAMIGLSVGDSLLAAMADQDKLPAVIDNWPEVGRHMLQRLRTESAYFGGDPVLDAAAKQLASEPEVSNFHHEGPLPATVPTRYRMAGKILSFISTIAQFGTAEDIALADLKIELMFPADEETRLFLIGA